MRWTVLGLIALMSGNSVAAQDFAVPDSGLVYIDGNVLAGELVTFRIDGYRAVLQTPQGVYELWELFDPDAKPVTEAPKKYIHHHAIGRELQAAVSASYSSGREAEYAAIQAVVLRHPDHLDHIEQQFWEGRVLDSYLIFWKDDGGEPEDTPVYWTPGRAPLKATGGSGGQATQESVRKQLQLYINSTIEQLNKGNLVCFFPAGRRLPYDLVFRGGAVPSALDELRLIEEGHDPDVHFIPVSVRERIKR